MSYRPGNASRETIVSGVATKLREIREHLGFPRDAGGRNTYDSGTPYNLYMRRLKNDLDLPKGGELPNEDDSTSRYLKDMGDMLKNGLDDVKEATKAEFYGVTNVSGDVVCCIVNALYEFAKSQNAADDIESARQHRIAYEGTVRDWVRLLRELLVAARRVMIREGVSAGQFTVELSVLKRDFTDILKEALESALAGILFVIVEQISSLAQEIDDEITDDIESTRCVPLMRIWAAVFDTLFHQAEGLIARTRAYLRASLVNTSRTVPREVYSGSIGRDFRSEKELNVYIRWTTDLIDILDAILAAISVFEICRVDRYVPTEEENAQPVPEQDQPDPGRPQPDPGGPQPDPGSPQPPDRPDRPTPRDPTLPPPNPSQPQVAPLPGEDTVQIVRQQDPDLGRVSVLAGSKETNDLYFTPVNKAKFMIEAFGVPPAEALRLAEEESCREQVSEDTARILSDLGVLPT